MVKQKWRTSPSFSLTNLDDEVIKEEQVAELKPLWGCHLLLQPDHINEEHLRGDGELQQRQLRPVATEVWLPLCVHAHQPRTLKIEISK